MDLEACFCRKKISSGHIISICSFWYQLPTNISSDSPLCRLWILSNSSLFYSDFDILVNSCNPSFILSNFFTNLKQSFSKDTPEFCFKFEENEEENTSTLDILYKIDNTGVSYVNAFKTILVKNFMQNPQEEFLDKVSQVCELKNVIKYLAKNSCCRANYSKIF